MKTITLEEHFTTKMYIDATAHLGDTTHASQQMEAIQLKQLDLGEGRVADMDESGIDLQALSLSGVLLDALHADTAAAVAHDANEKAAEAVREYPDRFAAFAAVSLKNPNAAADELKRCVGELGFKGGIVNGMADGLFLDAPRFLPFFEAAQSLGVPIYLHPAPPPKQVNDVYYTGLPNGIGQVLSIAGWGWHVETGLHALRLIVSGLFDKLPELQIVIGHMGEDLPFSIFRAESVLSRAPLSLEKSVTDYFHSNFHVTTSGYFTLPPFQCAMDVVGVDRLLFSVDYPYSTNKTGRAFLDSLPVSEEEMEKISYRNAEKLLKL